MFLVEKEKPVVFYFMNVVLKLKLKEKFKSNPNLCNSKFIGEIKIAYGL